MTYHNETPQSERREILKSDTYLSRAASSVGAELGGRFAHLAREQTVVGTAPSPWPTMPANNPWARDPVPDEKPLGYSVNDLEGFNPPEQAPIVKPTWRRV
jgi:hypothetical protein